MSDIESIRRQMRGVWVHEEFKEKPEPQCPRCGEPVYERRSSDGKLYYVCATKKCGPHNPLFPEEVG